MERKRVAIACQGGGSQCAFIAGALETLLARGATEPIEVRLVRMSQALAESLDYPSKLSRNPAHIARLIADGEAQASAFLGSLDQAPEMPEAGALPRVESVEAHAPSRFA